MQIEPLRLTINGETVDLLARPGQTLLSVLRDDLEMTGTKTNCLEAECGVCAVAMDGMVVNACLLLARQAEGHEITTIEGLAADPVGRALQASFVRCGAVQCGYCIPGMIVAARALLADNPDPGREEIREGLAGVLCRCTGYRKIVDAVRAAADDLAREGAR